ncbi:MAG TPA: RNA polymerase sigma factor [Dysgonamonadaceae bacterium]|jgi:RNA polymerase sigma-70 factor (ECF subfamily)|nr:RNA polymerase sigma factor [Dysgonamonadaceae bacterium]
MDDSQLIEACKKKDRDAQKKLYEMYAPKMMGVCLRYCKNNETAWDLLHDGFFRVFTHIGSYSGKGSFEGWMRRVFVNLAIENYRREQQKNRITIDIEQIESDAFVLSDDDSYDIGDITHEELLDMIRQLPKSYRTIFNLFVFEDMSHKEIGKMLGINESTSRSQYSRARAILRKKINAILKNKQGKR